MRLQPYEYRGWRVHHYIEGGELFLASKDAAVLRAKTKTEIEAVIDRAIAHRNKTRRQFNK